MSTEQREQVEALVDNGPDPSDIALAGESAGGGLAVATLVNAHDHGLPLPAAAFVMSPYADLTLSGTSMETKREVDPLFSRESLEPRVTDYTPGHDAALGLISPTVIDEAATALDRAGQFLSARLCAEELVAG